MVTRSHAFGCALEWEFPWKWG